MNLGEWLTAISARRRVPGEWDCCAFPAAWAMALGFPDPMAGYRGAYSTEERAAALIRSAGGLLNLMGPPLDAIFPRREFADLKPGDIGVLRAAGIEAGSIYTGKRWALVLDRGLGFQSLEAEHVQAAWGSGEWAA